MKIAWNKVTWYSKLIALILFVALPFVGFWLGAKYGETVVPLYALSVPNVTTSTNSYYMNVAEWQTETRLDGGFNIAYPIDFQVDENYSTTPSTNWRVGTNTDPGLAMFTLTIPADFEPQTNFADATLTIGKSSNPVSVSDCMNSDEPEIAAAPVSLNGVAFSVFKSSSVGAGNMYETTSYRTVYAGTCFAIEYTIHSSQLANYPSQYNLQAFNETQVTNLLNRIVNTFRFN